MVDSIKKPQKMGQGMIHSVSTQKICRLDGSVLWIYLCKAGLVLKSNISMESVQMSGNLDVTGSNLTTAHT